MGVEQPAGTLPKPPAASYIDGSRFAFAARPAMPQIRQPAQIVTAMATQEGAGVTVHRALGTPPLPDVDPVLMLDEFKNDDPKRYMAGFPHHPHRGMETVTYMLAGAMRHRDNQGNEGRL